MTVATNLRRVQYVLNGVTTAFPVPFPFLSAGDLQVTRTFLDGSEAVLALNADYTVAGAGSASGGTVTFPAAGVSGERLTIRRTVARVQLTDYVPNDPFPAEAHERALDLLTMMAQEDGDELARAVMVADSDARRGQMILPPLAARAGRFMGFDADGLPVALSGTGADGALRADLVASGGSALVGYGARSVAAKLGDVVSVLDSPDIVADGVSNDSAALLAFCAANKGKTIVIPAGVTVLAAGLVMSGPTWNGTRLVIDGVFKMAPSGGGANFQGVTWCGIVLHDCWDCSIDIRGWLDGNRAAQAANQQHYAIMVAGGGRHRFPILCGRELRGDMLCFQSKTLNVVSDIPEDCYVGPMLTSNSAYDGRNALTFICGRRIVSAGGIARRHGGVIGAERMPGGVDIEPDAGWQINEDIHIGPWVVDSAGTSGIAIIGRSITENDANEDWNVRNVTFVAPTVFAAQGIGGGGIASGPIMRRAANIKVLGGSVKTNDRTFGWTFDFIDGLQADISAEFVGIGCDIGFLGVVRNFDIRVNVKDYAGPAVLVTGASRGRLTLIESEPAGAGSFGLQIAARTRTVTQDNVVYVLDVPFDVNLTAAVLVDPTVTIGAGTHVQGQLTGYSNLALQCAGASIPFRQVEGRNYQAAVPTAGFWHRGEFVENTQPSLSAGKVTQGWRRLTSGNGHVLNTDWAAVVAPNS
jgi:hypothetical protein